MYNKLGKCKQPQATVDQLEDTTIAIAWATNHSIWPAFSTADNGVININVTGISTVHDQEQTSITAATNYKRFGDHTPDQVSQVTYTSPYSMHAFDVTARVMYCTGGMY